MSTDCLAVKEPWAGWIVDRLKDVENRLRPTKHRGRVMIHASKGIDKRAMERARAWTAAYLDNDLFCDSMPPLAWSSVRGAIIGEAHIADCVQDSRSAWAAPGMWHWVLDPSKAKRYAKPVPYLAGRLGIFKAPSPDKNGLFLPHDNVTRQVDVREQCPTKMITRPGKWGNPFRAKGQHWNWLIEMWNNSGKRWTTVAAPMFLDIKYPQHLDPLLRRHLQAPGFYSENDALKRCLEFYELHIRNTPALMKALPELKGQWLGCYCKAGECCHGDVLVRLVKEVCGG